MVSSSREVVLSWIGQQPSRKRQREKKKQQPRPRVPQHTGNSRRRRNQVRPGWGIPAIRSARPGNQGRPRRRRLADRALQAAKQPRPRRRRRRRPPSGLRAQHPVSTTTVPHEGSRLPEHVIHRATGKEGNLFITSCRTRCHHHQASVASVSARPRPQRPNQTRVPILEIKEIVG
jgi:hypothetical protein